MKSEKLNSELELGLDRIKEILINNNLLLDCNICNKKIKFISCDSREIKSDTLFFCKGKMFKEEYLIDAIENGATTYIAEENYNIENASYFIVSNILKAVALISSEYYKYPGERLTKIGITGTKGKTTVTYFLNNILQEYSNSCVGLISTLETNTGKRKEKSRITTPEAMEMQKYFYEMAESNIKYATVEVSSQSYKRYRLEGVEFEYGMFLNIDKDHISSMEHPNFEDYLRCKCELLKNCNNVLININTNNLDEVMEAVNGKNIVFFGDNNKADYYVCNVVKESEGFSFTVKNDKINYKSEFSIKIAGRFNVENALAAIAMSKMMGVDDESIRNGLLKTFVPGRMNIYEKEGLTVVIDYAHNKLSFEKLYESIKLDYPNRRIISVGGTVGGKAYNRREEFGQVVGRSSDYIILTANDPQFEGVKDICEEIGRYIPDNCKYEIIEDRENAINEAFKYSESGDVIVLLSKGTDKYQKVANKEIPYESDVKIVEDKFARKF